jgi:hypothetical protein
MAIAKTIIANGSKGHHKFSLTVTEDRTSGNSSFLSFSFVLSPIQTGWDWAGWGGNISYVINIGNNSYNGTIASYNGSSSVTLRSGSNIEIAHETDGSKTIDISFSVTDTSGVNYTCGNANQKGTLELSRLHEAPTFNGLSFKEINQQLVSLGVGDNYFASNLSIKDITIRATPLDGAKITKYEIINGGKTYESATNVVRMDLQKNPLGTVYLDYLGRNVAELTIRITDDKDGVTTVAYPDTYVIPYTKPSIEKTSTTIKRKTGNGTVLTDNIALLNFVGSCYKGNDVIGNNNKPAVQYKIWNTTEPENYTDLTTPNIANVTIRDYEINNILYTSPYNYKIKIYDTFTNEETTISLKVDKVPTGVSVWTEYPDRVDYLAITRQGKQIYANIYSFNEAIIGIYNNKPLYRKMIDFGALNNAKGTKEVAHNIENIDMITDVKITGYENEYAFPIPFVGTSHMFSSIDYTGRADKTNVYIYVSDDRSSQTAIVTLEYTKTSD